MSDLHVWYELRDGGKPNKVATKITKRLGTMGNVSTNNRRKGILLFHGYNQGNDNHVAPFRLTASRFPSAEFVVGGIQWASMRTALGYMKAYCNCLSSANLAAQAIVDFTGYNVSSVSLVGHSMGTVLMLRALEHLPEGFNIPINAFLCGSDAAAFRFLTDNVYGRQRNRIKKFVNYYSPYDKVLGFPAIMARPWKRAGKDKLGAGIPAHYESVDANIYHNGRVNHSDYKNMPNLYNNIKIRI